MFAYNSMLINKCLMVCCSCPRSLCVVRQLEILPSEGEAREKAARCAYYLNLLLKLTQERQITRKCE